MQVDRAGVMDTTPSRHPARPLFDMNPNGYSSPPMRSTPLPTPDAKVFDKSYSSKKGSNQKWRPPEAPSKSPPSAFVQRDALSQFTDVLQKRFEVVGALGDGSFSEVLKVRENETGRTYALKNVKKPNKNTLTEFFCAAELGDHENLIKYYEVLSPTHHLFGTPPAVAFLLEYVGGGSLENYLSESDDGIDFDQLFQWTRDLLEAVQYIHAKGFIHLDIKPGNVLITHDNHLKLGDFGLMIRVNDFDHDATMEGDDRYMAPELLESTQVIGTAADMFSVGVVILEMAINLEIPKGGESSAWSDLRTGKLPGQIATLPPVLQQLITCLLDPIPARRPSAEDILEWPEFRLSRPRSIPKGVTRRRSHPGNRSIRRMKEDTFAAVRQLDFVPQSLPATSKYFSRSLGTLSARRRSGSQGNEDVVMMDVERERETHSLPAFNPRNLLDEFNSKQ